MKVRTETRATYAVDNDKDEAILAKAAAIFERRARAASDALTSPEAVRGWVKCKIAILEHEVFGCIWLNAQNQVIDYREMFRGTLTQTSVYPREVAKEALKFNAAAVILVHNHPSGTAEPSHADEALTRNLKMTLAMVDVKVLDHFVVTVSKVTSFAERGLL